MEGGREGHKIEKRERRERREGEGPRKTGIRWGWFGLSAGETVAPWKLVMFILEFNREVGLLYTASQEREVIAYG